MKNFKYILIGILGYFAICFFGLIFVLTSIALFWEFAKLDYETVLDDTKSYLKVNEVILNKIVKEVLEQKSDENI